MHADWPADQTPTEKPRAHQRSTMGKCAQLAIFALAASVGAFMSLRRPAIESLAPLVMESRDINLGEVLHHQDLKTTAWVHNPNDRPVTIQGVQLSCNCITAHMKQSTIAPRGKSELILEFHAAPQTAEEAQQAIREIGARAVIDTGNPETSTSFDAHGELRNSFEVTPWIMDDRKVHVVGSLPTLHAKVKLLTPMKSLACVCDKSLATSTITRDELDPMSAILTVEPAQTLAPGVTTFNVALSGVASSADNPVCQLVPARFRCRGDIMAAPATIEYGALVIDQHSKAILSLTSHSKSPFKLASVECNLPEIQIDHDDQGMQNRFSIPVDVVSKEAGRRAGTILFSLVSGDSAAPFQIAVPVQYYGLEQPPNDP